MINTETEFAYLKLCFENPQLWTLKFTPIDPQALIVCGLVDDYRSKYSKYPTLDTFLAFTDDGGQQSKYIRDSFAVNIDKEFVLEKVLSFVETERFKLGLNEANELLLADKLQEAKLTVIKSMEMIYNLPVKFSMDEEDDLSFETVSTGFECLDFPLGGGGHRKNMILIIGPSGIGKSIFMLNMGAHAKHRGQDVVHITLENSTLQTKKRYRNWFEQKGSEGEGKLYIQEFPTGGATVADFDALINGYRPDLVLIDYLNEVSVGTSSGNTSKDLGEIARGMRAIAQRYNNLVITAQQGPKHKRLSDVDVTAEDGFWSYEPTQVSDAVLTMNQTIEEKKTDKLRISLDKNRNGQDKIQFPFDIDYKNAYMTEVFV